MDNGALEIVKLRQKVKDANDRAERLQDKLNLLRAAYREGTDSFTFRDEAGRILGLTED